jgi:hypothetical protein
MITVRRVTRIVGRVVSVAELILATTAKQFRTAALLYALESIYNGARSYEFYLGPF